MKNTTAARRIGSTASILLLLVTGFVANAVAARERIELIVEGDYVVPMDTENHVIRNGAVAIDKGAIVAIGLRDDIAARYHARDTLHGGNRVVMPGLINGHTHAAMTLLRGIADDLELMDWLTHYIFPTEVKFVDADFVRIGTELACLEMIRGGTTTFVDMYYFPDTVARAVERCGLRAVVAATVINQKSPDADDPASALVQARAFITKWQGKNPRITPALGPHAIYTLNPELLRAVRALADELHAPISMHMSESLHEIEISKQNYQTTPIELFQSVGFLDHPIIAAHVIYPTDNEMTILAERHIGVIHNPTSNMKIASGIAPVAEMLRRGIAVGLGTDGAATNNDLDMWEEMRLSAFLQKVHTMDPTVLPAPQVLRMATAGGAQAIGLGDAIGSLTVGRRADLIQVSLDDPHFTPMYDVVSHLVYVADEQDVSSMVVEGAVVMRERKVLTLDSARVQHDAGALAAKISASFTAPALSQPSATRSR